MIFMDAKIIGIGTTFLLIIIFFAVVVTPKYTNPGADAPSEIWRPRTEIENLGQYCHSQYVRNLDWDIGSERVAQAGDYNADLAPQLGSIRTGPDLSQEGGEHSDDWHGAHFFNPRYTRPESIMPPFEYFEPEELDSLIAYVQSLGGKMADYRVERQWKWRKKAISAYESGIDQNIIWLHSTVPDGWLQLPNPYPANEVALEKGSVVYQRFCIGCHGPVGDGQGPASRFVYPPPLNFTTLRRHGLKGGATGGMLYYHIMNGITGTAMPYFKRELESEKIWDVSNYVAKQFIGIVDANREPRGIDAAYEPPDNSEERAID
jgi:cytochrome c oxidase cbb3-type subunit II